MIDVTKVLRSLAPDAGWSLDGSEIIWEDSLNNPGEIVPKNLIWHSKSIPMPTREQIDTRMVELQAIADTMAYQDQRRQEYPPLENLADALFWQAQGDSSKMTVYLAQVAAVKDKYPKGTV